MERHVKNLLYSRIMLEEELHTVRHSDHFNDHFPLEIFSTIIHSQNIY